MTLPDPELEGLDEPSSRWIERTRSTVLNILIVYGLSILATALVLKNWGRIEIDGDPAKIGRFLFGSLFIVFVVAMFVLRRNGGRDQLQDGETRGTRYYQSRVGATAVGWLALPLGLAYGLTCDPELTGVAPFWLGAVVLAKLAFPRDRDLDGFDAPIVDGMEPPQ